LALTPGTSLGTYEILAPLGAGGMGEVYRARDRKLDRDVAIKVLPPSVAADPDALGRFEREAKAVAALSHPNILSIFDFGAQQGISYAVMELLEGGTLRERLDAGPITQKQAVDYALQIARGLSAAHGKGIVHRDLKPENLFVTRDGHLKILDFGLAKRVETLTADMSAPTRSGHTEPGTILGTAGYMSPEQVKGLPVDHRSDIFSFGVILYELLSGKRAFKRATNAETMAAIMRDDPPELSESERNISPALDRIVKHCLEKDRDHRFQSARDIGFNLLEYCSSPLVSGREQGAPIRSAVDSGAARREEGFWVAVLPFKYNGADADLAALADGLSEDIVTGLSRFSYLKVIARSSTSRYVNQAIDVRAAGRELGARYMMEGNLRQAAGKLRLTVQLIDAVSGANLWAETYERSFSPETVFDLQDDLVPRIVSTVADWYGILPHSMSEIVRVKPTDQLSPYEALLRAFSYFERVLPEEHALVRAVLERAVEQAPGHAAAWAMLSMIYGEEYRFGFNARPDCLDRALRAALRAADLAPSSHLSHFALAQAHYFRKEFEAFRNAAERAIALNPGDGAMVEFTAHLLAFAGDWERGCELGERARELNPHHPKWYWALPFLDAYRKGDYRSARAFIPKSQMPGNYFGASLSVALYGQVGDREEAAKTLRDLLTLRPDFAEIARDLFAKWYPPDLVEQLIDGLRKAGLSIPARDSPD
jgi:serine/threonine protein kinase